MSTVDGFQPVDTGRCQEMIKSHPLFPLLEYFFFKCDRATNSLNKDNTKVDSEKLMAVMTKRSAAGNSTSDIPSRVSRIELQTGNDELDELMLLAVQVFRIQLLELEKVEELCKDFCLRYIGCLKGKVTQEMLGWAYTGDDESCSPASSPSDDADNASNGQSTIMATMQTPNGQITIPLMAPAVPSAQPDSNGPALTTSSGCKRALNSLLDGTSIKCGLNGSPSTGVISSRVIARPSTRRGNLPLRSSQISRMIEGYEMVDLPGTVSTNNSGKGKRGSLPREAVDIMRDWLFRNMNRPYPSEHEKRFLCAQSGLNLLQVNNWFINARRRILQPLMDGIGTSLSGTNDRINEMATNAVPPESGLHRQHGTVSPAHSPSTTDHNIHDIDHVDHRQLGSTDSLDRLFPNDHSNPSLLRSAIGGSCEKNESRKRRLSEMDCRSSQTKVAKENR